MFNLFTEDFTFMTGWCLPPSFQFYQNTQMQYSPISDFGPKNPIILAFFVQHVAFGVLWHISNMTYGTPLMYILTTVFKNNSERRKI